MTNVTQKLETKATNAAESVTNKAADVAQKAEAKAETAASKAVSTIEGLASKAQAQLGQANTMAKDYFTALTAVARTSVEGTIAVDKLVLRKFSDAAKDTAECGRELLKARDMKTAFGTYVGFVEKRLNDSVADTKEVLDLAHGHARDVIKSLNVNA